VDWAKAKTIIIIALLLTNLFLIFTYGDFGIKDEPETFNRAALIQLLEERGVFIEGDIPEKPKDMELLSVEVIHGEEEDIQALLDSEGASELFWLPELWRKSSFLDIQEPGRKAAYLECARNFAMALGIGNPQEYPAEVIQIENQVKVIFENRYDGYPLERSVLTVVFQQGKITQGEMLWLVPVEYSRKKVAVTDPAVALLALVSNKEAEENWRVEEIRLVYWLGEDPEGLEDTVADTAFPAWCIRYNGGEKKYVNAAQF
jgi:regulatory protein YycI of two-component signal transduction system YycFG